MEKKSATYKNEGLMELEHAIGYSGRIVKSVFIHPSGQEVISISGGCVVISDINDPHQQSFLREHDDQITCLAVSHDGSLIASGQRGDNSDVIIWDREFKRVKFKLSEHDYEVACLEFSHDDKLLFSCGNTMDKKIFIWDTANGYIVASAIMTPDKINCVRWGGYVKDIKGRDTDKYQLAVAGNKQICIWRLDPKTGILEHELINTGSTIREYLCLEFSQNKQDFLYAGTTSGDFCVFHMKNKVLASVINVSALGVTSIQAVSIDKLCVGGGNGTIALFKTEGAVMTPLQKITVVGAVNSLSTTSRGEEILASTDKGFVYRISPVDLSKALQSENHTESVVFVAYPYKISDKFASCSEDQTIRLWDVSEYTVEQRIVCPGADSPLCLIYSDEVILSGWGDDKMRMYRIDNGNKVWQIDNAHKGGVTTMCLSSNHKFICSGGAQGECRVWELRSREMVSNLKEHTHRVSKVMLWQDDLHLISASRDKALLCWDLKTEKRVSAHIQRMGGINSFDIVPGENLILTTGQDRKITYWDLREPNAVRSFETNNNPKRGDECFSLAVSHNGKFFATGGSEEIVRLWDIGMGKVLGEGAGHSGTINTVAFSADDKQFISGGKDGSIFLWNVYA